MNITQLLLLEDRYTWTWNELGLSGDYTPCWNQLVEAHHQEGRVYHDLTHVFEMVEWLWENAPYEGTLKALLLWSAFYHDYEDTKTKTAEEDSAVRALSVYYLHVSDVQVLAGAALICARMIQSCILGTKGHVSDDTMVQWLIDADLQRFRCPDERFVDMIREEYAEHPDEVFNIGRKAILEKYAARRPFFYHSDGEDEALASINRQLDNTNRKLQS